VAVLVVRSTPGSRVCWPGRVFAGGGGTPRLCVLRRVVPSGAGPAGALRRSGAGTAPWRNPQRMSARVLRHMRDQARCGARDLPGHRPPGHPPRGRSAH
jgi:hypothetical protein